MIVLFGNAIYATVPKKHVNAELKQILLRNKGSIKGKVGKFLRLYPLQRVVFQGNIQMPHGIKYETKNDIRLLHDGRPDFNSFLKPPTSIYSMPVNNRARFTNEMEVKVSGSVTQSETWTNSHSFEVEAGVAVETAGKRIIGGAEFSLNLRNSNVWGNEKTNQETKSWEFSLKVKLPPKQSTKAALFVQKLNQSIDYTIDYVLVGKATATFVRPVDTSRYSAVFYRDWDYKNVNPRTFPVGAYNYVGNYDNDHYSSVKIIGPAKVIGYEHADFKGRHWIFTKNEPKFNVTHWGPNNKISSVSVLYTGTMKHFENNVSFNVVQAIPKATLRTFRTKGTWKGVSAFNGFGDIYESQPLIPSSNHGRRHIHRRASKNSALLSKRKVHNNLKYLKKKYRHKPEIHKMLDQSFVKILMKNGENRSVKEIIPIKAKIK